MASLLLISGYLDEKPTGGVAMHVHRLLKLLIEKEIHCYDLCDYKKEGFYLQISKIISSQIVHVHVSNPYLRLAYAFICKILGKKSILTVHGQLGRFGWLKNQIDYCSIRLFSIPILINKNSYVKGKKLNSKCRYIQAFIPPILEEELVAEDIKNCIFHFKDEQKKVFLTNASRRSFNSNGEEIYGIDFLISFFNQHSQYQLIILDPENQYKPIYNKKCPFNVLILTGELSFCGIMRYADFVIRNTITDGDSFSVKESLWFEKPVLATDVVDRPDGVILFKYSDSTSLEKAIINASINQKGWMDIKGGAIYEYKKLYQELRLC